MGLLDRMTRSVVSTLPGKELERRAAPGALPSPVQWTGPDMRQVPDWDGEMAVNSAYQGNLYVHRALNATADAISRLPFRCGMDPEQPQKYSAGQYSKLAYFLSPSPGSANPQWSPRQMWKYAILQYLITGKWAWLKEYSPTGQLVRLWPIPVQYLDPVPVNLKDPTQRTRRTEYFSGYEYRVQGHIQKLGLKDVAYFWNPSQKDHLQAESPLQSAAGRIGLLQMLERYDQALMKNNAVPTTIVATEPFAEPDMRRKFRQQFVSNFGGYDNAGKTIFVETDPDENADGTTTNNVAGKIVVERLGLTTEELQQNEKYGQAVTDVLVAIGAPMSVLGSARGETFGNASQEITNWWNERLLPLKQDLEDQINVRLAPQLGRQVGWFDISGVAALRPAPKTATDLAALAKPDATPTGPVLTRDEVRSELGLKPWADVPHPADEIPQEVEPEEPEQVESPPEEAPPAGPEPSPADQSGARSLLAKTVAGILAEQRAVLEERRVSRKGRKAETLTELMDADWHTLRAAGGPEPVMAYLGAPARSVMSAAHRLVEDSLHRLAVAGTVSDAYADAESRAYAMAGTCLRAAEPVPIDHVVTVLEAVRVGKIDGLRAMEIWEAQG